MPEKRRHYVLRLHNCQVGLLGTVQRLLLKQAVARGPMVGTVEIMRISQKNLMPTLKQLRGHLKATSLIWMHIFGVPVPKGLIIADWSSASARTFDTFCAKNKFTQVLLRIDKHDQRWTNRRGGYLLPLDQVESMVRELRRRETLAITLEPISPYCDKYSLAAVVEPDENSMTIEVVGPGFDASDLLRSDIQPHQLLVATGPPGDSANLKVRCTHMVDTKVYQATVENRLVKIGARLKNPAFPRSMRQASQSDRASLRRDAISYLKRTKQLLLLRHRDNFVPIPESYVSRFVSGVNRVLAGLPNYGIYLGPTSFAASFTATGRLVFWDFFPARTRDAEALFLGK